MKKILSLFLCSLFVLAIPATALATGYSGREIQPDAQGCYRILGEAGDTMTLIGTGSFLSNITVTLDDSADDIVCIDTYLTKPGSAPDGLPNIAHGYIDIQGDSFNAALDYALIRFSVSKDWLNQNNISRDNIRLYHYQNGSWFQLATSVVSESATVVVYSARTTSFSWFGISGQASQTAPTGDNIFIYIALAVSLLLGATYLASRALRKN